MADGVATATAATTATGRSDAGQGGAAGTRAGRPNPERTAKRRAQVLGQLQNPIVVAEDPATLAARARSIFEAFRPRNGWQDWLASEIAVITVRLDRCERIERRLRDYASYRAIDFWEEDQRVEVENVAARLRREPGKTIAKLHRTPAGCEWMLCRWRMLADSDPARWSDAQWTLARLLVGGDPLVDPAAPGFAAARVADLEGQSALIGEADEVARTLVEADLSDDAVPGLAKLRRYTRGLRRQLHYYVDQFHVEHPDRWDDPMRRPGFVSFDLVEAEERRRPTWSFAEPPTPPAAPPEVDPGACESAAPGPAVEAPAVAPDAFQDIPAALDAEIRPIAAGPPLPIAETRPIRAEVVLKPDAAAVIAPGRRRLLTVEDFTPEELTLAPGMAVRPSGKKPPKLANPVRDANARHRSRKRRDSLAAIGRE